MAFLGALQVGQPAESGEAGLRHVAARQEVAAQQQRVRQDGVAVAQVVFEPEPIGRAVGPVQIEKPLGQYLTHVLGAAIAHVAPQIFVDAEQREGPRARAGRFQDRRQRQLKQPARGAAQAAFVRPAQHRAQRPQRPPVAVIGAALFFPLALEG